MIDTTTVVVAVPAVAAAVVAAILTPSGQLFHSHITVPKTTVSGSACGDISLVGVRFRVWDSVFGVVWGLGLLRVQGLSVFGVAFV